MASLSHQVLDRHGSPQSTSKEIDDLVFFLNGPTRGMEQLSVEELDWIDMPLGHDSQLVHDIGAAASATAFTSAMNVDRSALWDGFTTSPIRMRPSKVAR